MICFRSMTRCRSICFDYAVVEKEQRNPGDAFRRDLEGSGYLEYADGGHGQTGVGHGVLNDTCENVHVVNELNVPILCMGLKNMVVAASPEGILVSIRSSRAILNLT